MELSFNSYMLQLEQALAFMQEGDSFLVVSHVQPDGDAISSTVAVGWLLEKLGKQVVLVNESELPSRLSFLDRFNQIRRFEPSDGEVQYNRVIAVDCADWKRMGSVVDCFSDDVKLLNIDHHPTNDKFGTIHVIDPDAAATAEILYDLIELSRIPLDKECATAIYTGLLTDTGGFRYSNTSSKVMEIASNLLGYGVKGHELADLLLEKMTFGKFKMLKLALNRLSFDENQSIGWLYITQQDMQDLNASSEDLEGIVNYALNVDGVEVGILFKEAEDGSIKASLRSAGKADVAAVAQLFGGGGHIRASGCRLELSMDDAIAALTEAARKALV